MNKKVIFLMLLAFIEGASVMVSELAGAKLIAPFFGSSLYVWAAVLGVTLLALMLGYYFGGYLSNKVKSKNLISYVLIIASIFLMIMPVTSGWVMENTLDLSIRLGSSLSLLVFMFPPLYFMGMSSPIIINMINDKVENTGRSAGSIYAISTMGGILGTFLAGFVLLPDYGVRMTCFAFGLVLFVFSLIPLISKNKLNFIVLIIPVFLGYSMQLDQGVKESDDFNVVYYSEGVLGQVKVVDLPFNTATRGPKNGRFLFVNNTAQTIMNRDDLNHDLWDWSYYYPTAASIYPEGSDMLLLGLGGGVFLKQFERLGFNVDVVELDQRIKDVAIDYFGVDVNSKIVVDDARRYINNNKKKYDIVFFDVFLNESPPSHVLTIESFKKVDQFLNDEGMIMINFFGYITGEKGRAAKSIYKTLDELNYNIELLPTVGNEKDRNLIFLATKTTKSFSNTFFEEPEMPIITNISNKFLQTKLIDFSDGVVLTDNQPLLEKLYIEAALEWRDVCTKYNTKRLLRLGAPN